MGPWDGSMCRVADIGAPYREDVTVTPDRPSGPPTGTSGYSGTPLHRKLGVRPGHLVLSVGASPAWPTHLLDADGAAELHTLTELGTLADLPVPAAGDVVLLFCPD